jgi:hypothetical protein
MPTSETVPIVYIVNESGHDFSDAERFGRLVTMTFGSVDKLKVTEMFRLFSDAMEFSTPKDYLLQSGPGIINMIAAGFFASKHGLLNLLIWDEGRYIKRTLVFRKEEL